MERIVAVLGIAAIAVIGGLYLLNPFTAHTYYEPIPYMVNIPDKPEDYELIKRAFSEGFMDIEKLNESYWLQPDFYPGWSAAKGVYEQHDYSRWGVYGHGAYPSNPTICFKTDKPGEWVRFTVLYRTGFGIETWQGVKLVPEDNEYFDVELNPNQMLLSPTFPVFAKDWVRKLSIKVTIKKQPPAGNYTVNIYSAPVDKELADKWYWEVLKKDTSEAERKMIEIAEKQAKVKGEIPEKFRRWIEVERKNRYVDAATFDVGPRITLKIVVEK